MTENGVSARIVSLEYRLAELERLEIQRTQEQVKNLREDFHELRDEARTTRKELGAKMTRMTNVGIAIVLALVGTLITALMDRIGGG